MVGDWNHSRLCWGLGWGRRAPWEFSQAVTPKNPGAGWREGGFQKLPQCVLGPAYLCHSLTPPPPCPCPLRLKGISRPAPLPWGPAVSTGDEQPSVLCGKVSGGRAILSVRPARDTAAVNAVSEGPGAAAFRAGSVLRELPSRDASWPVWDGQLKPWRLRLLVQVCHLRPPCGGPFSAPRLWGGPTGNPGGS